MLVLTRRPGQSVYIGDDIKITLVEIKGSQVRIGVEAPGNVRIFREEIYLQIQEENQTASVVPADLTQDLSSVAKVWSEGKVDTLSRLKVEKKRPKRNSGEDS
jgi:carbon storage regulator